MQNFANPWQCRQENRGDLSAPEIAGGQDEDPGLAGSQRCDLQRTVSQSLIFGEDDPASLTRPPEPDAVFFIAREMVVVDHDCEARFDEFGTDWFYAE